MSLPLRSPPAPWSSTPTHRARWRCPRRLRPAAPASGEYANPAGGGTGTAAAAAPATLEIQGLKFGPVTAGRGGRVVVQNRDSVAHTVTATGGEFDTGVGPKATVNLVAPTAPGSYRFTCLIHPQMSGSLVVR